MILLDATKLKTLEINHFGEFEKAIYNLRLGQHHQENLPDPPEGWTDHHWLKALTLRILQDANHQKDLRLSVARSLLDWRGVKLEVPQRAECLLWLQQFEEAIESLEAWMTQSPNSFRLSYHFSKVIGSERESSCCSQGGFDLECYFARYEERHRYLA